MAVRLGLAGLRRLLQQGPRCGSHSLTSPSVSNWLPNAQVHVPLPVFTSTRTQNSPSAHVLPALPNTGAYTVAENGSQSFRTFNTAFAAREESEIDGVSGGESGVIKPGAVRDGSHKKAQRRNDRRSMRESANRQALTEQIRAWPADVDLCEKFPDGRFAGRPIGAHDLRTVFYTVANTLGTEGSEGAGLDASAQKDATAGDVESTAGGGDATAGGADTTAGDADMTAGDADATAGDADTTAVGAEGTAGGAEGTADGADATAGGALSDDALRLLNVFNWWEARGQSGTDVRLVLHPLLKALAAAGMRDEIRSLWQRYQSRIVQEDKAVLQFMSASLQVQLYDDVIMIYETSKEQEWLIKSGGLDPVVRAMQGRGCSKDEVWEFYRTWVEKLGTSGCQRPGFVALLELGVSVDEIRTLADATTSYVQNRLVQALSTLGRRDEALALVTEYINGQDESPMGISAMVSYLRTLIQSGFVREAQQLADRQEKLGVTLKGALIYIMNKGDNRWTGLESYTDLLALEGSHKTSKTVQALLITNCYPKLSDTDGMYKAYLKGKELEGEYHAVVYARVIEHLTQDGRIAEAEEVLADYYEARRAGDVVSLRYSAFQSLARMYLQAKQPQKLVDMVNEMVNQDLFVNDWVTDRWISALNSGDHLAEAQLVRDAQKQMRHIANAWLERQEQRKAAHGRANANP